jgi:hypothetical protein
LAKPNATFSRSREKVWRVDQRRNPTFGVTFSRDREKVPFGSVEGRMRVQLCRKALRAIAD